MGRRIGFKERKIKTVEPIIVITKNELEFFLNVTSMLLEKRAQSPEQQAQAEQLGKKMRREMVNMRQKMTEWYKMAE